MSAWENRNAKVSHPIIAADATGAKGVHRIAADDAGAAAAIPRGMEGKYVRVRPVGCAIQYGFSHANTAPKWDEAAALGTGDAEAGATLADGEFADGIVPVRADEAGRVYFCHIAEPDGSGYIELWVSEAAI